MRSIIFSYAEETKVIKADCDESVCGVYYDIGPALSQNKAERVSFTFKPHKMGPLEVTEWEQSWTVLPWFSKITTNEVLKVKNIASKLKGDKFDRVELIKLATMQDKGELVDAPTVPAIPLLIPEDAQGLDVRDEIGIIWNSKNPTKKMNGRILTQLAQRFPIANGWSATTMLTYIIPFKGNLVKDGRKVKVNLQLGQTMALDSPIINYTACVSIPEDAKYFFDFILGM